MDWLNLTPRSNIVSSITRKILTTAQGRLTYQPVFRSPISAVLHRNDPVITVCCPRNSKTMLLPPRICVVLSCSASNPREAQILPE